MPDQDACVPPDTPGVGAPHGFRRLALLVLGALGVLMIVAAVTVAALWWSATAEVPEYQAVLEVDPASAEADRRAFESQLAALVSDSQALPEWKTRVTAAQVNAWLALRLERDFPGFRDAGFLAPRVILGEGVVTVAARSTASRVNGVLTVVLRPLVTEHSELALGVEAVRIGRLPLPPDLLVAQLDRTPLANLGPVRIAQTGDGAAIVVDLERIDAGEGVAMRLTGVDVRPGELLLRGASRGEEVAPGEESSGD